MASIVSKGNIQLFISYAPGTGSTALETYIHSNADKLKDLGFLILHFPNGNHGSVKDKFSRHISYVDYLAETNNQCNYVATSVRNPFSYYFAEYKRTLSKWIFYLNDKDSFIYRDESKATLESIKLAMNTQSFDEWFYFTLLKGVRYGYVYINENHAEKATHFIKNESITESFDAITDEIFSVKFSEIIGTVPRVNESGYLGHYSQEISERTKALALQLFGYYLHVHNYRFEDLKNVQDDINNQNVKFVSCEINKNLEIYQNDLVALDLDLSFLSNYQEISFNFILLNSIKNVVLKTKKVANDIKIGNFSLAFNFVAKLPVGEYTFNFSILDEIKKNGLAQKYINFKILSQLETDDNQAELPFEITFLHE